MRAVMSLVRTWIAGIGGFMMITAAFLVAMTFAISGPPTAEEMAELETATQTALQDADQAARAFGADMCVRMDLECAGPLPQVRAEPPPRTHAQPVEEAVQKPAPIVVAEAAPPAEPDPMPSLAGAASETESPPPRARESAARRTPHVRARRAAADREAHVRPHRREHTARAPRPRHAAPVTRARRQHVSPRTQPPASAPAPQSAPQPAAETPPPQAVEVNAPGSVRMEPEPQQEGGSPQAARNRADHVAPQDDPPTADHNAREQAPDSEIEPADEPETSDGDQI